MKKYGFKVLAVLSLYSFNANANVSSNSGIQLQAVFSPILDLHYQAQGDQEITVISLVKGKVIGATCKEKALKGNVVTEKNLKACTDKIVLEVLSKREQNEVTALVLAAEAGTIESGGPVYCEAIPTESYLFSARNGKILLSQGSRPCGGAFTNDSPSAAELIDRLEAYKNDYFSELEVD